MLGVSGLADDSMKIYGAFGGIRIGIATITADYEVGKNLPNVLYPNQVDTTTANALMTELAVKITQGIHGIFKYDTFAPDRSNTSANAVTRWTIGAEWYPVNFVEVIPQYRILNETSTAAGATTSTANSFNEFLIQLHLWI